MAGTRFDDYRITNDGRNWLRNAWRGESVSPLTTIVYGDDPSNLSRTNSALENQTGLDTATVSRQSDTEVVLSGNAPSGDVFEAGIEADDGTLLMRGVFEDGASGSVLRFLLRVADDSDRLGVVTTQGQTLTADVLEGVKDSITAGAYAYGSDQSDPQESDATLGNEVIRQPFVGVDLQSADTTSEWDGITSLASDVPLQPVDGALELTPVSAFATATDAATFDPTTVSGSAYESGTAVEFGGGIGQEFEWEWTVDHDLPEFGDPQVAVRIDVTGDNAGFYLERDTETIAEIPAGSLSEGGPEWFAQIDSDPLSPGTYTYRLVGNGESGDSDTQIDCLAVYDSRYTDTTETFDTNNHFAQPATYVFQRAAFDTATYGEEFVEVDISQTWTDTSGDQYIGLQETGDRVDNNDTLSAEFAPRDSITVEVGVDAYGSRTDATPTQNYRGQSIDLHDLQVAIDPESPAEAGHVRFRTRIDASDIDGKAIRESGLIDTNDNLLTRNIFAEFVAESGQLLIPSETLVIGGPNS